MTKFYNWIKKQNKKSYLWILLVGIVIGSCFFGGYYAKYAHKESMDKDVKSERFYFTSNYLTENGKKYTLSSGTKQVDIELYNYADNKRISDSTISYKYTVNGGDENQGSIVGKNKFSSTIELTNLSQGTYEVVVQATSPYTKTLKGTFEIPEEEDSITYSVDDSQGSPYVILTVSTNDYEGNIQISWPDGVIPDTTQEEFENVDTWKNNKYESGTKSIPVSKKYSSYTFQFLKTDTTKSYSENDIQVKKG